MLARKIPQSLQSRITSEDLLQQVFVDVFQGIESFRPRGPYAFYRWVSTIARHRLNDAIDFQWAAKRGGPGREVVVDAWTDGDSMDRFIDIAIGHVDTPSRSFSRREAADAIRTAMVDLKEEYRRAIQLRHLEGLPVAEVARVMNTSVRAVHNLCHRGLKRLLVILGESSDFLTRK